MVTIAVVAMGEMGSGVARRLKERGGRVLTSVVGRSAASLERARSAGAELVDDKRLIDEADIFLSIVPPSAAAATAERFAPLIGGAERKPTYLDCNAVSPETLHHLAKPFLARKLPFGDASIIGFAPRPDGSGPKVYMSGPVAQEAAALKALGLETRLISDALGDASAIKMAYGGVTKGLQAIGSSMALGAARAGVSGAFVKELQESQPALYAWFCKMIPTIYPKAYRWDDEMKEIAKFLEPERGAVDMLLGAATLYTHVAEHNRIGPQSEILTTLQHFVTP